MQQKIRQHIQRNYKLTTKQYMYTKLTINTQDIQLVLLGTDVVMTSLLYQQHSQVKVMKNTILFKWAVFQDVICCCLNDRYLQFTEIYQISHGVTSQKKSNFQSEVAVITLLLTMNFKSSMFILIIIHSLFFVQMSA